MHLQLQEISSFLQSWSVCSISSMCFGPMILIIIHREVSDFSSKDNDYESHASLLMEPSRSLYVVSNQKTTFGISLHAEGKITEQDGMEMKSPN